MLRWKARFHTYEVVTLPLKLVQWGRSLPPAALGASTPGQVETFVNRLWGLSYRMQALLEARAAHQSRALVRELRPDIRAWRTGVESILRSLAVEPESADYEDLRSRLRATLTRLEARIEETLDSSKWKQPDRRGIRKHVPPAQRTQGCVRIAGATDKASSRRRLGTSA